MHSAKFVVKLTILIAFLSLVGGCTHQAMNRVISSWQDQQISEAIAAWGQPSEELQVAGKHLYIWNMYNGVLVLPNEQGPVLSPAVKYCSRLLEVDKTGKISFGSWDGNNCPGLFSGWAR